MRKIPTKVVHGCTVKVDSVIKYIRDNRKHRCGVMLAERTHGHAPPFAVLIGWAQDTRVHYVDVDINGHRYRKRLPYNVSEGLKIAKDRLDLHLYGEYDGVPSLAQEYSRNPPAYLDRFGRHEDPDWANPDLRPKPPRFVLEQLPAFIRQVRQEFRIHPEEIYIAGMDMDVQQAILGWEDEWAFKKNDDEEDEDKII